MDGGCRVQVTDSENDVEMDRGRIILCIEVYIGLL